jgi:hypothetical protein
MEVIAIGPRDKNKAFRMTAERLQKLLFCALKLERGDPRK